MKMNTALILCAGYGKRLRPITLTKPKPLINIKDKSLLLRAIELVNTIGIKKVKINTYYKSDILETFVKNSQYRDIIEIINDGNEILDTGGGIMNMIKDCDDENFLVMNPDTIWDNSYKQIIYEMINHYQDYRLDNLLLVVNKVHSFDKTLKGDFALKNSKLTKENNNQYIYTGLQIINKNLFNNIKEKKFSMNTIWENEIKKNNLNGFESKNQFLHLTDIRVYEQIIKKL